MPDLAAVHGLVVGPVPDDVRAVLAHEDFLSLAYGSGVTGKVFRRPARIGYGSVTARFYFGIEHPGRRLSATMGIARTPSGIRFR